DAHCELDHTNALELTVATILSAQCTDQRVNETTPAVFAKYPTAADYAGADRAELEEMIRPTGFFRNKTDSLIKLGQALVDRFDGEVPGRLVDLVTLPGIGRKTANVILGNAFGVPLARAAGGRRVRSGAGAGRVFVAGGYQGAGLVRGLPGAGTGVAAAVGQAGDGTRDRGAGDLPAARRDAALLHRRRARQPPARPGRTGRGEPVGVVVRAVPQRAAGVPAVRRARPRPGTRHRRGHPGHPRRRPFPGPGPRHPLPRPLRPRRQP